MAAAGRDVNKSIFLIAQSMNWIEVNDQNIKRRRRNSATRMVSGSFEMEI